MKGISKTTAFVAACGLWLYAGCEHPNDQEQAVIDKSYVALSPIAVLVPKLKVSSAAEYFSTLRPNTSVLYVNGNAMTPKYKDGTAVVIEKIPFDDLREGMTVVFDYHDSPLFIHTLVKKTREGWRAIALEKENPDRQFLTSDRYVGIVIMAFSPED